MEPTDGKASREIRPWRGRAALDNPLRDWRGSHGITDRVPVALHNFLMACRMKGADFGETLQSGEALAEAELMAWRTFDHDAIMHESGVCAEAQAMGATERMFPFMVVPPVLILWVIPCPKSISREVGRYKGTRTI